GNRELLLADSGSAVGHRPRRFVHAPRAHSRDPGRTRPSHNRAMSATAGPEPPGTNRAAERESDDDVLTTPLQYLKGVGPRRAADLQRAGLVTIEDLLYRFPIRYEDRSQLAPIASLKPGQPASLVGRVLSCGLRSTRRPGFKIFEALVGDPSGALRAVWLNQPYLRDVFATGQHVVFYGLVEMRGHGGL